MINLILFLINGILYVDYGLTINLICCLITGCAGIVEFVNYCFDHLEDDEEE
jgi:hypothetical protein